MPTRTTAPIDRRSFLRRGTLVAAGAAAVTPFHALSARAAADVRGGGRGRGCSPDYGPLAPVRDHTTGLPLLQLPAGFEYLAFGWTGDLMSDGAPTPGAHDGMAAFAARRGHVLLVRNHERLARGSRPAPAGSALTSAEDRARPAGRRRRD